MLVRSVGWDPNMLPRLPRLLESSMVYMNDREQELVMCGRTMCAN